MWSLLFLFVLPSVLCIISDDEVGVTVRVDAGQAECFFQRVSKKEIGSMEVNWIVLKGGDLDISFTLRDPSQKIVAEDIKKMSGRHTVDLEKADESFGDYHLCFDNKFSSQTSKVVALHIYMMDREGNFISELSALDEQNNGILEARLEFFESTTGRIKSNLNRIESEQQTVRHVEYIDRTLAETNFENINFWGIVNSAVMLIAAFTQVYLIRSILSDDSKVGRLLRRGKMSD